MKSRIVWVGLVVIAGLALLSGSVLLIGYTAAAASLLLIATLLVRKALRVGGRPPIQSPVPRWIDAEEREAA